MQPLPRVCPKSLGPFVLPCFVSGRLRAQTPSGGSGPLRRACAPFAAKAAQGWWRQLFGATRGYALSGRSGLRPSLVRGDSPRNAPYKTRPATAALVFYHYPLTTIPCSSRSPSWTKGSCRSAVAVLRGPPCPPRTKVLPLPFFVSLSVFGGSKEVFLAAGNLQLCHCPDPHQKMSPANPCLQLQSPEDAQPAPVAAES